MINNKKEYYFLDLKSQLKSENCDRAVFNFRKLYAPTTASGKMGTS